MKLTSVYMFFSQNCHTLICESFFLQKKSEEVTRECWLPKFYKFFYFRLFSSLKLNCSFDKVTHEARHEKKILKSSAKASTTTLEAVHCLAKSQVKNLQSHQKFYSQVFFLEYTQFPMTCWHFQDSCFTHGLLNTRPYVSHFESQN